LEEELTLGNVALSPHVETRQEEAEEELELDWRGFEILKIENGYGKHGE